MEEEGVGPCKKNATRLGAHLVFIDESGFLLIPSVRRTWAPRGRTPILWHRYRHDRISAISAVSVSPRRRRFGLYYDLHAKNIQQDEVCIFLRHLLRHLRGHVIIVWDNGRIHGGEPIRELCRHYPRLHLESFPSYAPELNPDEGVWKLTKEDLANGCSDDIMELGRDLVRSLKRTRHSQARLRGCILGTELPLFL